MRIYTKAGDKGETGLIGGARVSKDDVRVEAYGTVDELNSALGVVRACLTDPELDTLLLKIQSTLFDMGAELACPPERIHQFASLNDDHVQELEQAIDRFETELEPLRQFILPGGTLAAAFFHQSRSICRRAERRVVTLGKHFPVREVLIHYLNRLSDLLFVMARTANGRADVEESKWEK
jgi:cob(I)alamin adenosyltransferase